MHRRKAERLKIEAAAPKDFRFVEAVSAGLELTAAEGDAPNKPKRFSMTAYTGGAMNLGFGALVVVDLAGAKVGRQDIPILRSHEPQHIVGHTDGVEISAARIKVKGFVSGVGEAAQEVLALAANGFPWQASIGASSERMEFVDRGETVKVNGRNFTGPIYVARATTLREVSFVPIGADGATSASVAAQYQGEKPMFEKWLTAKGFDPAALTDIQRTGLQASFDAEEAAKKVPAPTPEPTNDPVKELRANAGAELTRIAAVTALAGKRHEIAAKAIAEGLSVEQTKSLCIEAELKELKDSRPVIGPTIIKAGDTSEKELGQALEAALCLSAGMKEKKLGEQFDQATMNRAMSKQFRGTRISTVLAKVMEAAGVHPHSGAPNDDTIRAALNAERTLKASGFSTLSLSGILGNTANKALIDAYTAVETKWPQFCAVRSHGDFKVHTRYRLDSTGAFKKIAADGALEHIGLSEASYTNQLGTYGAIIAMTRQMMINDDLGAFLAVPQLLGRMSALRVEEAVHVLLLSNPSSFFAAGNRNYASGAGSALSLTSLTTAENKFRDQVDSNNKPVLVSPMKLLVPTPLAVTARDIFMWQNTNETTTANAKSPNGNPHVGKYDPIVSTYLSNTNIKDQNGAAISGQSSTGWYLFANPAERAAIAVAFLNGAQMPVIESSDTEFQTLGMQWRAYHDFGVGMEETVAAVFSTGA